VTLYPQYIQVMGVADFASNLTNYFHFRYVKNDSIPDLQYQLLHFTSIVFLTEVHNTSKRCVITILVCAHISYIHSVARRNLTKRPKCKDNIKMDLRKIGCEGMK
jgi:hypothetical protein